MTCWCKGVRANKKAFAENTSLLFKDYPEISTIVDDKEVFHDTWEQWHNRYQASKKQLESQGLKINDVVINIDDLIRFCFQNGIKNDGKARSQFVAQINF